MAELGLRSWQERRWLNVPDLTLRAIMTCAELRLPRPGGGLTDYQAQGHPEAIDRAHGPAFPEHGRLAAAHVVSDPLADVSVAAAARLGRDPRFRRYLWALGLAIAEAMDTAQRGMGLGWETPPADPRSVAAAEARRREIACGAGTDHLADPATLDDVGPPTRTISRSSNGPGASVILMASRALAAAAPGADDYLRFMIGCSLRCSSR